MLSTTLQCFVVAKQGLSKRVARANFRAVVANGSKVRARKAEAPRTEHSMGGRSMKVVFRAWFSLAPHQSFELAAFV